MEGRLKYQFQWIPVTGDDDIDNERPEYEKEEQNDRWETILEANTAEDLLVEISDWLNDENYPTNHWTRILVDGKKIQ